MLDREYKQQLRQLDIEQAEYRKNKEIPGTPEYEAARKAEEIFSTPHKLFDEDTKRIGDAILRETFNPIEKRAKNVGLAGMKVSYKPVSQKDY